MAVGQAGNGVYFPHREGRSGRTLVILSIEDKRHWQNPHQRAVSVFPQYDAASVDVPDLCDAPCQT